MELADMCKEVRDIWNSIYGCTESWDSWNYSWLSNLLFRWNSQRNFFLHGQKRMR
nr:MAG TPA: hypothetical protein [Caudoviricetes sp.]